MSDNSVQKSAIRRQVRTNRTNIPSATRQKAESSLTHQLKENPLFKTSKRIACFLSFDGEIGTQTIISESLSLGKQVYLPKLRPFKPNRLWFMPYTAESAMSNNRFNIPEVDLLPNHAIALSSIDLVLLPLVAFDSSGNRLGMGGGFYDATFAHLRKCAQRPKFIGLAYQQQRVEPLPSDPWDLPLDGVCTEQNFYHF